MPYRLQPSDFQDTAPSTGGYRLQPSDFAQPSFLSGLGAGIANVGRDIGAGLGQLGSEALQQISPSASSYLQGLAPSGNISQSIAPQNQGFGGKLIQGGIAYAPYALGGEFAAGGKAAALLPRLMGAAGASSTYAAAQPGATVKSVAEAAPLGPVQELMGMGASKLVRGAAAPVNTAMRYLSKEAGMLPSQVSQVLGQLPAAFKTNLGDLIKHQGLAKFFTSKLGAVPLSGVREVLQEGRDAITGLGNNIVSHLQSNVSPSEVDSNIQSLVRTKGAENIKNSNAEYNALWPQAQKSGVQVIPTATQKVAQDLSADEKQKLISITSPKVLKQIKALSDVDLLGTPAEPSQTAMFQGRSVPIVGTAKEGTPPKVADFKTAHKALSDLGQTRADLYSAGNIADARLIKPLHDALRMDLETAVNKTGDKDLISKYETAGANYAKNVVPFQDKSLAPLLAPDHKDISNIAGVLSKQSNSMSLLRKQLPQKAKNLIGFAHISKAMREKGLGPEATPEGLLGKYNILGSAKQQRVMPAPIRAKFKTLATMMNAHDAASKELNKPETGALNQAVAAKSAMGAALATASVLHPHVVIPATAAFTGVARGMQKLLSSDYLHQAYANQMLPGRFEPAAATLAKGIAPVLRGTIGSYLQNNQGNQN